MTNENEINVPSSILEVCEDVSETTRISDVRNRPEDEHTEIKVITHNDDFDALEQKWNELAWESDTRIFQTFEWNRIWWRHFGTNKKLHIVAVYTGNKLTGVAPLFEDDITLMGRNVYTSLRFLGSYVSQPEGEPLSGTISYSDYLDCIVYPGYEKIFYKHILQHFNEVKSGFDEIILDEVSEESGTCNTMIPLMAKSNSGLSHKVNEASSSPVILLDSTWEAYLKSMSSKARYTARRYYKRSKQGKDKEFKIDKIKRAEDLPGALSDLIRMHQQQWNSRGYAGTFSEKRMRDFFMEIVKSFYDKNWIEFNMAIPVNEDNKYVAVDVLLTYKNSAYLMHRGMDEDPLYKKLGPGNVLLYASLNKAIHDGVRVFDMLRGEEDFKLRLATKVNQNKKISIRSDFKTGRLFSGLVKQYLTFIRQVRIEKSHIKLVLNDKPIFKGITDYIQFLHRRIKYKFYD